MKIQMWHNDKAHSELYFQVRHLSIATLTGRFNDFDILVKTFGDSFENAEIVMSTRINSISTGNKAMDERIMKDDFFYADAFPELLFTSISMKQKGENIYLLLGYLTIKGIRQQTEFIVHREGTGTDPFSNEEKTGFSITGIIKRKDFNLLWDVLAENGAAVLSDEVKIGAEIELAKTKGEEAVTD